jgi:hypothetical protein
MAASHSEELEKLRKDHERTLQEKLKDAERDVELARQLS